MDAVLEPPAACMSLPENLRRARDARGWTQSQVAAATGVPLRSYQNWETGLREPLAGALARLAAALGVTADALLAGVADPPAARGKRK